MHEFMHFLYIQALFPFIKHAAIKNQFWIAEYILKGKIV
jgi:hypothetical protein